jgi:uncharacterized membrane protein
LPPTPPYIASKPASQQASKPASQQASKPASQQASKPASQQASKPAKYLYLHNKKTAYGSLCLFSSKNITYFQITFLMEIL